MSDGGFKLSMLGAWEILTLGLSEDKNANFSRVDNLWPH